ncbi:hypothetical protein U9M48_012276 [Paspalum notatum var. saurae]|uniref:Uncharacterized protein n=1 Tax=Paspalum notatum var. saurae TaxID=547442 RepID=A0AAQ3SYN6_PASNO
MANPRAWRRPASWNMGLMWPWYGSGKNSTRRRRSPVVHESPTVPIGEGLVVLSRSIALSSLWLDDDVQLGFKLEEADEVTMEEEKLNSNLGRAFSLIRAPSSPAISLATASATFPLSTSSPTSIPTPHSCVTYLAVAIWSAKHGCASMGTPSPTPSSVEFHPQCVQNAPTARCANTSRCGAHATTFPLPSVSSANPSGNGGGASSSPASPPASPPARRPGRTTHRNDAPLAASPHAISSNAARATRATSTERGARASSHARQPRSGARSGLGAAGDSRCSGPTANAGRESSPRILASAGSSMASNVFTTTPDAVARTASATRAMKPHSAAVSLPSTRIRSRTRRGSRPGTSSSILSSAGMQVAGWTDLAA